MQSVLLKASVAVAMLLVSAGGLFAQDAAPSPTGAESSRTWVDAIDALGTSKLTILLIFAAGVIAAAGYAVAGIIRAFNGSPDDSEALSLRIDELEDRVEKLEARSTPPSTV